MACWCNGACPHLAAPLQSEKDKKPGLAEKQLRAALLDAPQCPEAHLMLAHLMVDSNRAAFALDHVERAHQVLGDLPAIYLQRAITLRNMTLLHEAVEPAQKAVNLMPENPRAHAVLVDILQSMGNTEGADQCLAYARDKVPGAPIMRRLYALQLANAKDYAGAVALLQGDGLVPMELLDRGRYQESAGNYADAWRDWMQAKAMQRAQGMVWNGDKARQRTAALFDSVRRPRLDLIPRADPPSLTPPAFITGFPRSGTTMVEAALGAHPRILPGDELMMLPDTIALLPKITGAGAPYPRALLALAFSENKNAVGILRDFYIRKAHQKIAQGTHHLFAEWFTDKMPSNEWHWPLISILFPTSPIFHLQRHPLDIVISNMSHHLVHGGFVSCGLESFAENMVLVDGLTQHYLKKVEALRNQVITVRYESFVADHRAEIDVMLTALNLPPDPACYDFHKSEWFSRTISHRQIKEPVHDKSVGRYKPFAEFLKPVLPMLAPIMEREGYTL